MFAQYASIGTISIDGNGSFVLTQTVFQNGTLQRTTATGTYSVGVNCTLDLKFNTSAGAATGGFTPPALFKGLVANNNGGSLVVQPNGTDSLTGTFVNQ